MSFNEGVHYTTRWEEERFSKVNHPDINWSIEKRGFVAILEHIRQTKTPVVMHGAWLDLLLILKQFYVKGYPETFSAFKSEVSTLFPTVYDTAAVIRSPEMKRVFPMGKRYLEAVYNR